jgi:hypothetical protein
MNANRPKRAYHRHAPEASPVARADEAVAVMDEAVTPRPEMRAEQRPAMREESSRDRAARRASEILGHMPDDNDAADKFRVDPVDVPDGFTYEWKRHTTLGAQDPSYQVSLSQYGWEPVPVSRHPQFMPSGWKGQMIEREGMVLYERPAAITEKIRERDRREAMAPIQGMKEKLSGVPQGQFARVDGEGRPTAKVAKAYSPVDIPGDAG